MGKEGSKTDRERKKERRREKREIKRVDDEIKGKRKEIGRGAERKETDNTKA